MAFALSSVSAVMGRRLFCLWVKVTVPEPCGGDAALGMAKADKSL